MRHAVRRLAIAPALSAWDALLPIHAVWWALFGVPMLSVLHWAAGFAAAYPVTLAIGPFGVAVIATTLLVRLVLLPLTAYQVRAGLRARIAAAELQARLEPAVARLRRKYGRRPLEFQRALAELRRAEGVRPMGDLARSLLPALVQAPLLIALYSVILVFAHSGPDLHFLWIANLALPDPVLLPVIAGTATYLLTRAAGQPVRPEAAAGDGRDAATARWAGALLSPLGLVVFAHFAPAALALYWATGSLAGAAERWVLGRLLAPSSAAAPGG
jgi:YidC/Oxa1 family membrane protein insertase